MLNTLYPEINWPQVKYVGFDLDGTLYDEFCFIRQVYHDILLESHQLFDNLATPLNYMLDRWLEKGSSYNRIFDETCARYARDPKDQESFVATALETYRHYRPELTLPERNRQLLQHISCRFQMFLITDGPPILQRNKFKALGLKELFQPDRVVFTGELGKNHYKPDTAAFDLLNMSSPGEQIVYFGDRENDREFCHRAGIQFQLTYNMVCR